jgi:hypothetical protein
MPKKTFGPPFFPAGTNPAGAGAGENIRNAISPRTRKKPQRPARSPAALPEAQAELSSAQKKRAPASMAKDDLFSETNIFQQLPPLRGRNNIWLETLTERKYQGE